MIGVRSGIDEYGQPAEEILSGYVGEFKYFGFESVPPHCLACDGSEISRTTYSELFAVFGETFGAGDGVTTFNLPDLRGAFLRCIGGNAATLGVKQGDAIRNLDSQIPYIRSVQTKDNNVPISGKALHWRAQETRTVDEGASVQPSASTTLTTGNVFYYDLRLNVSESVPTAIENRPVNVAVNICVVYE